MANFTPISALIGGLLIGLSTLLLLRLNGRIAGISGIFHGLFLPRREEFFWRLLFLIGLILGGCSYYFLPSIQFTPRENYPTWILFISGILVSLGTRLGGGCTSGHGVCGLARLSLRSLVATLIFLFTGFGTVYFIRHLFPALLQG